MCVSTPCFPREKLTFVADEWCPYNCAPGMEPEGFAVDIARRIFEEAGYEVVYQTMPWTRALLEVTQGRADAAIGVSGNEAPHLIFPVEPCGMSDNAFFTEIGSKWRWDGIQSLRRMRTAFIRDYDYGDGDDFHDYIRDNKNSPWIHLGKEDDALPRNLRLLARGRVDVVVADVNVGNYLLKAMGLEDAIKLNSQEHLFTPIYIAFSQAHANGRMLADTYDTGIDKLRASGELARIMSRYGLANWQNPAADSTKSSPGPAN